MVELDDYIKPQKWILTTKAEPCENIAHCVAADRIVATDYFATVKRLTPEQLLEIFNVILKPKN